MKGIQGQGGAQRRRPACAKPHDMKTSGHLLAGMGGKKQEEVIITHAHLLEAAETLAGRYVFDLLALAR